ncbi:MAG: FAD-dependent oxidoreductase [Acidimicrobiia bacterium]|nr:FAD-dependent oxidoreductase [Acidimicrobiia bacterium]
MTRVVIVGASLAGLRAAETLRMRDHDGEVVIVGAERHRPYDRPPLSKKLLAGEWDHDRIHLRQPDTFDDLDVEWRFGSEAVALDLASRSIRVAEGAPVEFGALIIATGASPRRLPDQDTFANVHVLRTVDDALALRAEIADGDQRVIVIGAGFIGLEAALTAHGLGNEVTVLEGAPAALIRGLGAEMGEAIGRLHIEAGVDLRCGVSIAGLESSAAAEAHAGAVRLADGSLLDADVILVGIGVEPATAWLADSGLELRDGVVCDETLLARTVAGGSADGVYAAGDVARWWNPLLDEEMRVEHWTNAAEQGARAAENLLAVERGESPEPYAPVPFVWSDQGDLRIQMVGHPSPSDDVELVAGSAAEGKLLALYGRDGLLRAALGVNAPRWVMPMRKQLLGRAGFAEARSVAIEMTRS